MRIEVTTTDHTNREEVTVFLNGHQVPVPQDLDLSEVDVPDEIAAFFAGYAVATADVMTQLQQHAELHAGHGHENH